MTIKKSLKKFSFTAKKENKKILKKLQGHNIPEELQFFLKKSKFYTLKLNVKNALVYSKTRSVLLYDLLEK